MLNRDPSERVTGVLLLLIVLSSAVLLAVSFGVNPFSTTPSAPGPAIDIRDAPERAFLNESGEVALFTITNMGGPAIQLNELRILIGPPGDNVLELSARSRWRTSIGGIRLEAHLNGSVIWNHQPGTFAPGDTIIVKKTAGTLADPLERRFRVRLVLESPDRTIADQNVAVR